MVEAALDGSLTTGHLNDVFERTMIDIQMASTASVRSAPPGDQAAAARGADRTGDQAASSPITRRLPSSATAWAIRGSLDA